MLVILTAVEKVCVNFGKPDQAEIDTMTIAEAEEFIAQGQFAPGSMLPKVEACIEYVRAFPEARLSSRRSSAPLPVSKARRAPSSRRKAFCV